jgi:hypothetical protein
MKSNSTDKMNLVSALNQIDNIVELTKDNEWKTFLYQHLSSISCELNRQLSTLDSSID